MIGSDYVVCSPFPDVQLPTDDVYTLVTKNFSKYASKIGLIDGVSGQEYSYNEIHEAIRKFSSGLQGLGFAKGDVLTIVAPNSTDYPIVYLGTLASGGVISPCNPSIAAEKLAYQFKNSSTKFIVTVPAILPIVQEAAAASGAEKIILLDSSDPHTSTGNVVSYNSLVAVSGATFNPVPTQPDDIVALPYTSATTLPGIPKGVMLTNRSIGAMVLQYCHPEAINPRSGDHVIGVCPLFHSVVVTLLPTLYAGSTLVILPAYELAMFLSSIERYQNTIIPGVPPLVLFLAKHPLVEKYDLTSIKDIQTGAAPVGVGIMKDASERVNRNIRQAYGLTEAGPSTHMMPRSLGMQRPGSIGQCLPSMKAKIVDLKSGEALPPNKEGEVWLQGPTVMKGYLNNPESTQNCMTDDGWFKTGDLGYYDERGLFYIKDRIKELVNVKDSLVAPAELEAVLLTHPKIADAAVIGVPDDTLGEVPKAFVVKKEEMVSEKEIQEFVAGKVSEHKHLAGGVTFIKDIPKSASGKILRREQR